MNEKLTITIRYDDDGMFGSSSTDGLNVKETFAAYEQIVETEVKKVFENATVEFEYAPHMKQVSVTGAGFDEEEDIIAEVQDIIGEVYNDGKFWIFSA